MKKILMQTFLALTVFGFLSGEAKAVASELKYDCTVDYNVSDKIEIHLMDGNQGQAIVKISGFENQFFVNWQFEGTGLKLFSRAHGFEVFGTQSQHADHFGGTDGFDGTVLMVSSQGGLLKGRLACSLISLIR